MKRRVLLTSIGLALALTAWTSMPALAAMDATLSSYHGRVGDVVLLLTDNHNGVASYLGLSSEGHQKIYLSPAVADIQADISKSCVEPRGQAVGELVWRGNAGGVTFALPNVPTGDYWVFMLTRGQCWRIGGSQDNLPHPIVLAIGDVPADNQAAAKAWTIDQLGSASPQPEPSTSLPGHVSPSSPGIPWLPLILGVGVLFLVISMVGRRSIGSR